MADTTITIELSTSDLHEAVSEWATKRFGVSGGGQDSGGTFTTPWKVHVDIRPAEVPDPPYAAPTPASVRVTATRKP